MTDLLHYLLYKIEKIGFNILIPNFLHTKGISEKHEILHILKQIKNLETLQQQINIATGVKSNLVYETTQLQDKENNLEINNKSSIRRNQFLYQNQ